MRFIVVSLLFLFSAFTWSASAKQTVDDLVTQVSPLWKSMRPACLLAKDMDTQQALETRLQFLDGQLIGGNLSQALELARQDRNPAWNNQSWPLREQLEASAIGVEEREAFREYFFKLQTQKPNKIRSQLIEDIQFVSEELNLALRQELWKTCHSIGMQQLPPEQMEEALDQRWQQQEMSVASQLKAEVGAFYFYAFRAVENTELAVLSKVALELKPWAIDASEAITQHFQSVRANMLAIPLDPVANRSTDEPFLEDRPWRPEPALSPFQP